MVKKDIIEYIEDNDVKFIRLGFCDLLGFQKNISIISSEFKAVINHGRSIDASALPVFSDISKQDLRLYPDLSTLRLLPWRPQTNAVLRFYCDIKNTDNTDFIGDSRSMLKRAINELSELGFMCMMGTKCEFYLFKNNEFDEPTTKTLDEGGYLDISPLDKGENIRREICLCLEDMGLSPETSHHEQGPGQNEIDFKFSDPLSAADNFLTFKSIVKSISSRNGLFASFMPKPFRAKSGSGLHLNISLYKDGKNIFADKNNVNFKYVESFIAGILEKIAEITLFLNPINNSYERLGACNAPEYVGWSYSSRSQLIRVPTASKGSERLELRAADPTVNPYISFALILKAGIYGIKNNLKLPKEYDEQSSSEASENSIYTPLPKNLGEAIALASKSEFVAECIGKECLSSYVKIKESEYNEYLRINKNNIEQDNCMSEEFKVY